MTITVDDFKSVSGAAGTDGTTVTDSATTVLGAIGANNNDNAFASTSVVANEDGSVLERLEFIQAKVGKGSGTAIAANKAIADALGTDGNAVTDSAVSVLGAIGANNNNNAYDSSSIVSNADGSVLERLEYLQALDLSHFEQAIQTTAANLPQTAAYTIFTVTGGPIVVSQIVAKVTTSIQVQANASKFQATDAVRSITTDLCTTSDITGQQAGNFFTITGTLASAMGAGGFGAQVYQATPLLIPAGTIKFNCAASNTGQVQFYMRYRPLGTGVTVTAAF